MHTHAQVLERLSAAGLELPPAPKPVAAYVPCVRTGDLIFVSGQLPMVEGKLSSQGKIPSQVPIEAAQVAARRCVLNALAVVAQALEGDLGRLRRVVRLGVFVQSDDDFTAQPVVANGASEFLRDLFGEAGTHARAAVGVNTLPLGASVEVEMIVEVKGQ